MTADVDRKSVAPSVRVAGGPIEVPPQAGRPPEGHTRPDVPPQAGRPPEGHTRPEVPPQAGRPPEGHTRPEVPPQAGRPPEGHTRPEVPPQAADRALDRLPVTKAYKMYVGGAFVRSESGRTTQARGRRPDGSADPGVVNVPRGSRKDARDAVLAAKNAGDGWAARTAYNRGQILYRLAEVMESRAEELRVALARAGGTAQEAEREVVESVDRAVYYAGFCDKFQALVASSNPVAGPHFGFSVPEPMGVVAVLAPDAPPLLGLVSTVLPIIASANTCVAVVGAADPRAALVWCECLATSDLPAGVVNVITGAAAEIAPHVARHREVAAVDAWTDDAELRASLERDGSGSIKRVRTHDGTAARALMSEAGRGLGFIEAFLETKTVWHPVGI